MNLGSFLNEFVANLSLFWALFVGAIFSLGIFGYFYNRLMDHLKDGDEHTSLYVAIGVSVTIAVTALFSWKAGLLNLIFFIASGSPMIMGEFIRTKKKVEEKKNQTPRRKRLPYAANGRIDDAVMDVKEASRLLGMALKEKEPTARALQLAQASHELNDASTKLLELKLIQQIEE